VPFVSLLLAVILAHSLIGPFGRWIGDGVAFAAKSVMTGSFAPIGAYRKPNSEARKKANGVWHGMGWKRACLTVMDWLLHWLPGNLSDRLNGFSRM
jgi:hypothetical protein